MPTRAVIFNKVRGVGGAVFICLLWFWGAGASLQAQPIYQGPAVGSISGGAPVSTAQFSAAPSTIEPLEKNRIMNPFWEKWNPPLVDDALNNTPPSAPLGSNQITVQPGESNAVPPMVVVDFHGLPMGNSIPPDPHLAVGPNHVIVVVNTRFAIYDKQGNQLFSSQADNWFSNVLPNAGAFDPIVLYDHFEGRWIMVWDNVDDVNNTGFWLVSVSDDDNPMGTWCNYAFPAHLNGNLQAFNWGDYEKAGFDDKALYITGRMFSLFGAGFQYCKLRIIPKSELYNNSCGPVSYTDFWNFREPNNPGVVVDGPPIVATHIDVPPNNKAYMIVDAPYNTSTFVTLWTIDDPVGSPSLSAVNIPTTAALPPPNANQLGGGFPRIDSGRRTYRNVFYKDGDIWSATAIAGGTGNQYAYARYIRVDVATQSAEEDLAIGEDGGYALYPAAVVDSSNNMVMVYSRSADDEYVGFYFTGRRASDPANTLAPETVLKPGEGHYIVTFGGTRNRWGDYMGAYFDPAQPTVVWGLVEYAAAPQNVWDTWVGAFTYAYGISGVVRDAVTGDPIDRATIDVVETGRHIRTDSTGAYAFGSPQADLTVNVSAFAYQSQTLNLTLTFNQFDTLDILLDPELEATISGQVRDATTGAGVPAYLEFFAEGDPTGGPYVTATTDSNGNYSVTTIIGTYDIVVDAASPYPTNHLLENVVLDVNGLNLDIDLNPAEVMLVDDDEGSSYESYYLSALEAIGRSYHYWKVQNDGVPTASDMAAYPSKVVVWYTGDGTTTTLTQTEQDELLAHLTGGGRLFLTGQNIAEQLTGSALLTELGVDFAQNTVSPVVRGVAGDIGDGIIMLTGGSGGANNQTSRDQLAVTDSATTRTVFTYGTSPSATAGAAYQAGDRRAVFFGFGYEAVNPASVRETVMQRVIDYLFGPVGIEEPVTLEVPGTFRLFANYPNPFNPTTVIPFGLPRAGEVEIAIYTPLGQKVRTLVQGRYGSGVHKVQWDGRDDRGVPVTSGVYIYRLSVNGQFQDARKLVLLR